MTDEKARPLVRLFEGEMMDAEYARTIHVVTAKAGAVIEDFLEPEAYAHVVGRKVKVGDRLEITAEDRTWFAEILILNISGLMVQPELLRKFSFEPIAGKEHDAYEISWGGPTAKWRVLRKTDRAVMVDKLGAKSEAVAWIEKNGSATLKQAA